MTKTERFAIQWRRHWNILRRFAPGYNPKASVISGLANELDDSRGASPEEAYWAYQETGKNLPCHDQAKKREYLERKAGMDLTISMWKENIRENQRRDTAFMRILVPQAEVLELTHDFPVSFLAQIGILEMVGLTIRQCGMRLATQEV